MNRDCIPYALTYTCHYPVFILIGFFLAGIWTLNPLQNTAQPNTYEVIATSRFAASCPYYFLSATACYADLVDIYDQVTCSLDSLVVAG